MPGYRAGQDPLPDMPMTVDLQVSYGAVGDGKADDTQALLNAINDVTDQAVIYIPPGTELLSQKIDVSKRVVSRGLAGTQQHLF